MLGDICTSSGARNWESTSQRPPATRTTGTRACDDAIRTHAAAASARAYARYRRGLSVFGGSGRVPYILGYAPVLCLGSPWRRAAASAAASFAAAVPDGLRRGPLRLPLALLLSCGGPAPKFANGTECRWRLRLSLASVARASLLPEYSWRALRRFRASRRLPTVHWRRNFISSTPVAGAAGAGGTTLSDIVRGRIHRRIARKNASVLVKPRRVVKSSANRHVGQHEGRQALRRGVGGTTLWAPPARRDKVSNVGRGITRRRSRRRLPRVRQLRRRA